jgi:hypothetical protein
MYLTERLYLTFNVVKPIFMKYLHIMCCKHLSIKHIGQRMIIIMSMVLKINVLQLTMKLRIMTFCLLMRLSIQRALNFHQEKPDVLRQNLPQYLYIKCHIVSPRTISPTVKCHFLTAVKIVESNEMMFMSSSSQISQ